jgi:hypothetical protein
MMYGEIVTLRKGRNRHFALCCEKGAQNCCAKASFFCVRAGRSQLVRPVALARAMR